MLFNCDCEQNISETNEFKIIYDIGMILCILLGLFMIHKEIKKGKKHDNK